MTRAKERITRSGSSKTATTTDSPAARVLANGMPVLVQTSTGLCMSADAIPNGPPLIIATQPRVIAT